MAYKTIDSTIGSLGTGDLYNYQSTQHESLFAKFFSWCEKQERNHFLWLALSFVTQIGLTLPLTAACIVFFGGNNFFLWIILVSVNVPVLALNLAAFPTKTTLPFVFLGWLTQAVIVVYCLVSAFFIKL